MTRREAPTSQERTEALGKAVRSARTACGLSQESLGYRSGLDRTYISGVERGVRNPTLKVLFTLADALGLRLSELLRAAEETLAAEDTPA